MAALHTITNLASLHPLAVQSREHLTTAFQQSKAVTLFWIKAHVGLEGNERADHLAKEAAQKSKTKPHYDGCPVSFVKQTLRARSLCEWSGRYQTSETGGVTKIFFPDAVAAYRIVRKFEATNLTTQILTGRGGLSEYLHRFRCKGSPSCICDPDVKETVPHILTECPVFGFERMELANLVNCDITVENMASMMASKYRDTVLNYCTKIVKVVNARNRV